MSSSASGTPISPAPVAEYLPHYVITSPPMSPTAWSGCACRSSRFWKVGPYMAHAGSLCMNLLYGFPGLQLGPSDPQSWA
jgi:hypothetical protein